MRAYLPLVLVAVVTVAGCSEKKALTPFVFPQTPTEVVMGKTVIFYETYARSGDAVRVAFEVSKDDGRTFQPATPADGAPPTNIVVADPFGAPNFFFWDSFADLGPGVFPRVVLRATGFANGATGRQAVTSSFPANESGSFTNTRGAPGAARSGALAAPLPDGSVLLAGGSVGSQPTTLVEVYDPVTEQAVAASALASPRTGLGGALLESGRVLIAGGTNAGVGAVANAEIFDRATNAITGVTGGLAVARTDAAVAALPGGSGVVVGGVSPAGVPVAEVELYDPNVGTEGGFSVVTSHALAAVRLPTATPLPDGRVFFAGGAGANGQAVATTFLFDPITRSVTAGAVMSTPRVGHRATRLVSGRVLLAGGRSSLAETATATATVELYDPDSNGFTILASMSRARAFHGQDLAGGRVVAVGGAGPAGDTAAHGEVYDVDTNAWLSLPFAPLAARTDATLVTSGPGRALLSGGGAAPELYHPLGAVRTINPNVTLNPQPNPPPPGVNPTTLPPPIAPIFAPFVSEAWLALRAPSQPRAFHTASVLPQGGVLLVGGTSGVNTATSSVELFEVAPILTGSDAVSTRAPLAVARARHGAATTSFGTVFVVGGVGATGTVLGSIERYDSFRDVWTTSAATLARPRYDHHVVALFSGDLLIVGGRDANGVPVGQAELYHPFNDTIEPAGTLTTPRADDDVVTATGFGQVLLVGGRDAAGVAVRAIDVYDVLGRSFSVGGSLAQGRIGLALANSADFRAVIATGGHPDALSDALATYEGIDLSGPNPVPVAGGPQPLDAARGFHKAALYQDRVQLLTGGEVDGLPLDTSSLYIPAPSLLPTAPSAYSAFVRPPLNPRMNMPRVGFTATALGDGRVLVVGGVDHRGVVIPGLEVFVR